MGDEARITRVHLGRLPCVSSSTFAIIVGAGILAATAAYIVCETTGQRRCESIAAHTCTKGAKSVKKVCDFLGAFGDVFKNGQVKFNGSCDITCK